MPESSHRPIPAHAGPPSGAGGAAILTLTRLVLCAFFLGIGGWKFGELIVGAIDRVMEVRRQELFPPVALYLVTAWLLYPYRRRKFSPGHGRPDAEGWLLVSWGLTAAGALLLVAYEKSNYIMTMNTGYFLSTACFLAAISWQVLPSLRRPVSRRFLLPRLLWRTIRVGLCLTGTWGTGWLMGMSSGQQFDPGMFVVFGLAFLYLGWRAAPLQRDAV